MSLDASKHTPPPPHTPDMPLHIEVALTTADLATLTPSPQASTHRAPGVCIVVDVIRATTSLAVLFERGCAQVLATSDIATARAVAAMRSPQPVLAGEVGGVAPLGFALGNSPAEIASHDLRGQEIVFATTNGTRALLACPQGSAILTAAFYNGAAAADLALALARRQPPSAAMLPKPTTGAVPNAPSEAAVGERIPDIVIVCSGRNDRPAYDDTLCAGHLVARLMQRGAAAGRVPTLGEGALIALAAWEHLAATGQVLHTALARSEAGRAVRSLGLEADLDWCATRDASRLVPTVIGRTEEPRALIVTAQTPPGA